MDYKKNQKYFRPKKSLKTPIIIGIVGLILCTVKLWIGLLVIAGLIAWLYLSKRPSDAEIDAQVDDALNNLKAQAIKKLGIDEEEIAIAEPLITYGYSFGKRAITDENLSEAWGVQGKDYLWRSPIVQLSFFGFSENEIYFYRRYTSMVSDTKKEITSVINYKDVVSVKSASEVVPACDPATGQEIPNSQITFDYFELNVPGDSISCAVRNSDTADETVKAIRALVKQKKNS